MFKKKRLNRPRIPMDADDVFSLMENCAEEFKVYHVFCINWPLLGEKAIGFMSPKWISII